MPPSDSNPYRSPESTNAGRFDRSGRSRKLQNFRVVTLIIAFIAALAPVLLIGIYSEGLNLDNAWRYIVYLLILSLVCFLSYRWCLIAAPAAALTGWLSKGVIERHIEHHAFMYHSQLVESIGLTICLPIATIAFTLVAFSFLPALLMRLKKHRSGTE